MVQLGLWIAALVFDIRLRRRPAVVLLVPVTVLAAKFVAAWLSETLLGWTA